MCSAKWQEQQSDCSIRNPNWTEWKSWLSWKGLSTEKNTGPKRLQNLHLHMVKTQQGLQKPKVAAKQALLKAGLVLGNFQRLLPV